MSSWKCDKCQREFAQKSSYTSHINRKRPCVLDTPASSSTTTTPASQPSSSQDDKGPKKGDIVPVDEELVKIPATMNDIVNLQDTMFKLYGRLRDDMVDIAHLVSMDEQHHLMFLATIYKIARDVKRGDTPEETVKAQAEALEIIKSKVARHMRMMRPL